LLQIVFKRIVVEQSGVVAYEMNAPFNTLLLEEPDVPGSAPDLETGRVRSTIKEVLEFDDTPLNLIIDPVRNKAA
jgi:hypothetical protein